MRIASPVLLCTSGPSKSNRVHIPQTLSLHLPKPGSYVSQLTGELLHQAESRSFAGPALLVFHAASPGRGSPWLTQHVHAQAGELLSTFQNCFAGLEKAAHRCIQDPESGGARGAHASWACSWLCVVERAAELIQLERFPRQVLLTSSCILKYFIDVHHGSLHSLGDKSQYNDDTRRQTQTLWASQNP